MRHEKVSFYSEGDRLSGDLYLPDQDQGKPWPAIVQGPGFLGLKDARHYIMMFERLCQAGYACLVFDYRGWGESEGRHRGWIMPLWQVEDIRNGITYLETRPEIDPHRIATYGSGGTGGANAVYVAAIDPRVKCVVCYLGISSGRDWLHCMRREYEWVDYLKRIEEDRKQRVLTGAGEIVSAREEIMVATPERKTTTIKKEVEEKIPERMPLQCAQAIIEYNPEEVVHKIAPRASLFIAVENDAVTPEEQSVRLYEKAGEPKKLILFKQTTHYGIYNDYFDQVASAVVDWYDRYLKYETIEVRQSL
ncbi:MAG TPA: alpha/beta hydrolase [Candidatus Acidoferrales bacterium]|nr:alpha/beta hydrolase [Candidatus Acidoferrales bacterium]